ncbi:hypothetical protein BC629DRAFT_626025 [Irpex lacteus]|nr:hypothetical protein BC629DRAFT_626025 [Irpex lacteus]
MCLRYVCSSLGRIQCTCLVVLTATTGHFHLITASCLGLHYAHIIQVPWTSRIPRTIVSPHRTAPSLHSSSSSVLLPYPTLHSSTRSIHRAVDSGIVVSVVHYAQLPTSRSHVHARVSWLPGLSVSYSTVQASSLHDRDGPSITSPSLSIAPPTPSSTLTLLQDQSGNSCRHPRASLN